MLDRKKCIHLLLATVRSANSRVYICFINGVLDCCLVSPLLYENLLTVDCIVHFLAEILTLFCKLFRLNHPVKKFKAAEPKPEPSDKRRIVIPPYNYNGLTNAPHNLSSVPESTRVKQEPSDSVLFHL